MKSALVHLEHEFEQLLDHYCYAMESGRGIEAALVELVAEDYAEAIDVLKLNSYLMEDRLSCETE